MQASVKSISGIKDPNLISMSASAIAVEIEKDPELYVKELIDVQNEYLKIIFEKLSYVSLRKFLAHERYRDLISSEMINSSICRTENHFRNLFATDRKNPELDDPHLMLINAFENHSLFEFTEGDDEEKKIPRLFPLETKGKGHAIVDQEQFLKNFKIFSEGQLEEINWSNVFVAGGSILSCLQPLPTSVDPKSKASLRQYFQDNAFKQVSFWSKATNPKNFIASDIDIFIYGLSPKEANERVKQLYNQIKESNPTEMLIVRTPQAITFVSQFPFRHIQIILRCYKSPAEVLMGFDIDCCCVGFDGKNVWTLPRFHRAVTRQYNRVDLTRRSTTYESRLMKYSYRGFEVAVPGFDRSKIDPKIFEPTYKASGLALLLRFEKSRKTAEYWQLYDPNNTTLFENEKQLNDFNRKVRRNLSKWYRNAYRLNVPKLVEYNVETGNKSDYSSTFLPWGPTWNARKINGMLFNREYSQIYGADEHDIKAWRHDFDIENIFNPKRRRGSEEEEEEEKTEDPYETQKVLEKTPFIVKWLTVEPGRQFIGSFHPQPAANWDADVYKST